MNTWLSTKEYIARLQRQGSLASLRDCLAGVLATEEEDVSPAWAKFRLEEIDFFLNTLDIRSDAINYYGDYHNGNRSIFQRSATTEPPKEQDSDSAIGEIEMGAQIAKCKVCGNFIRNRNFLTEKLAKTFFWESWIYFLDSSVKSLGSVCSL